MVTHSVCKPTKKIKTEIRRLKGRKLQTSFVVLLWFRSRHHTLGLWVANVTYICVISIKTSRRGKNWIKHIDFRSTILWGKNPTTLRDNYKLYTGGKREAWRRSWSRAQLWRGAKSFTTFLLFVIKKNNC